MLQMMWMQARPALAGVVIQEQEDSEARDPDL
jgi:hypothetical protein